MTFRIRPNHERMFSSAIQQPTEQKLEIVEDVVFVVDEDTGNIVEQKQFVEQETTVNNNNNIQPVQRKESAKVFGLSMKKRTKVSFM